MSKLIDGDASQVLPEFVWLLRDVDCIPTSDDGKELSPTDYLTSVLQKNKSCSTSSTLLQNFPTFQCFTIPPPSADSDILADIAANFEFLSPLFNARVDSTILWLKANISAKVVGGSATKCDGKMLACLIEQYFTQISRSNGSIPTIQVSWLKAIELRLMKLADSLVSEYDRDMQAQLEGKLPMMEGTNGETGETLMNIHLQVFAKKRLQLQKDSLHFLSQAKLTTSLELGIIREFDKQIAQLDSKNQVTDGRLFRFIQANMKISEDICTAVYIDKYKPVDVKLRNILSSQMPGSVNRELEIFGKEYHKHARGPALQYIYSQMRAESLLLESHLQLIPGPVEDLRVVGADADRVKLKWMPTEVNSSSVETYEVLIKSKGKDWEVVGTRPKNSCSVLVVGLKSSTWYCLSVRAKSSKYSGNKVSVVRVRTLMSKSIQNTVHASAVVASPIVYPCMVAYAAQGRITSGIMTRSPVDVVAGGFMLTMVPFTAVVGMTPIAGQLASSDTYKKEIGDRLGDLEEGDTEVLEWGVEKLPECSVVDVPSDSELEGSDLSSSDVRDELEDLDMSDDEDRLLYDAEAP